MLLLASQHEDAQEPAEVFRTCQLLPHGRLHALHYRLAGCDNLRQYPRACDRYVRRLREYRHEHSYEVVRHDQ
ncbi:hypothetical protein D3C71_1750500 [compost metagenome]